MIISPYRFPSAPNTLFGAIIADGPVHYWRNAEASGAVMVDEITTDGSYIGSVSLGNAAIYTGLGAPTCATGFAVATEYGISTIAPGSLTNITLVSVVQFNSLSGIQPVGVSRDTGGSSRMYQWRSNGADMEFVKIVGGVSTVAASSVFVAGVTCIVGITISAAGAYVMYKNGASVGSGSLPAANYGGAADDWQIGAVNGMGAAMDGYVCENAVFNKVISGARMATYASLAGL